MLRKLTAAQAAFVQDVTDGHAYRDDWGSRHSPLYATYTRAAGDPGRRTRVRAATVDAVSSHPTEPPLIEVGPPKRGFRQWELTDAGREWITANPAPTTTEEN